MSVTGTPSTSRPVACSVSRPTTPTASADAGGRTVRGVTTGRRGRGRRRCFGFLRPSSTHRWPDSTGHATGIRTVVAGACPNGRRSIGPTGSHSRRSWREVVGCPPPVGRAGHAGQPAGHNAARPRGVGDADFTGTGEPGLPRSRAATRGHRGPQRGYYARPETLLFPPGWEETGGVHGAPSTAARTGPGDTSTTDLLFQQKHWLRRASAGQAGRSWPGPFFCVGRAASLARAKRYPGAAQGRPPGGVSGPAEENLRFRREPLLGPRTAGGSNRAKQPGGAPDAGPS